MMLKLDRSSLRSQIKSLLVPQFDEGTILLICIPLLFVSFAVKAMGYELELSANWNSLLMMGALLSLPVGILALYAHFVDENSTKNRLTLGGISRHEVFSTTGGILTLIVGVIGLVILEEDHWSGYHYIAFWNLWCCVPAFYSLEYKPDSTSKVLEKSGSLDLLFLRIVISLFITFFFLVVLRLPWPIVLSLVVFYAETLDTIFVSFVKFLMPNQES